MADTTTPTPLEPSDVEKVASKVLSISTRVKEIEQKFFPELIHQKTAAFQAWLARSEQRTAAAEEFSWIIQALGLQVLEKAYSAISIRPEGFLSQNFWVTRFTFPEEFLQAEYYPAVEKTSTILGELDKNDDLPESADDWQEKLKVSSELLSLKVRSVDLPGLSIAYDFQESGTVVGVQVPVKLSTESFGQEFSVTFKEIPLFSPKAARMSPSEARDRFWSYLGPVNLPAQLLFRSYMRYVSDNFLMDSDLFARGKIRRIRLPILPLDAAILISSYVLTPFDMDFLMRRLFYEEDASPGKTETTFPDLSDSAVLAKMLTRHPVFKQIGEKWTETLLEAPAIVAAGANAVLAAAQDPLGFATSLAVQGARALAEKLQRGGKPENVAEPWFVTKKGYQEKSKALSNVLSILDRLQASLSALVGVLSFHILALPVSVSIDPLRYEGSGPLVTTVQFYPLVVFTGYRPPWVVGGDEPQEKSSVISSVLSYAATVAERFGFGFNPAAGEAVETAESVAETFGW